MLPCALRCLIPVLFALAAPLVAAQLPPPAMAPETTSAGRAEISPATGISGEFGTWTLTYHVGSGGIAQGGGIRVQLPDTWHAGPQNSGNRLQATDPRDAHYVQARSSRSGVRVVTEVEGETAQVLVKAARESLDGRSERYVFVVRAYLAEGSLREGDTIEVIYGDRSGGGPGMLAAAIATQAEPVLVAVDAQGESRFRLHEPQYGPRPALQALAGAPVELQFHVASNAVIGEPLRLLVVLLDKQANPVLDAGTVRLHAVTGRADFPEVIRIPAGRGYGVAVATPREEGILRLGAEAQEAALRSVSNPSEVSHTRAESALFWGDLHVHSSYSWDGVGHGAYEYARYVSGLDFFALTDHSGEPRDGLRRNLSRAEWAEYNARAEFFNDPPHFVTLHAYECSFGTPWGHHNVYFRDQPGPLFEPADGPLPDLWKALKAGDALTIPHHTGKMPIGVRFSPNDPERRRNFEIYSGHGLSEALDPEHPLAFENSDFTSPGRSVNTPSFAQDAWIRGVQMSTVAASDDHRSQPGQPHWGLAAIRAPVLTRDAIFQGLYDRHTYGTTGAKIILDVQLNGVPMGQSARISGPARLQVRASGTDTIEWIEVLKHQAPSNAFVVVKTWRPDRLDFADEFLDENFQPGATYYVRLKQKEPVRNRPAMAWSSPIWTLR